MSRADLRKRVAALSEAINPAGSLTAKLASLTNEQRQRYQQWRRSCMAYFAVSSGGAPTRNFSVNRRINSLFKVGRNLKSKLPAHRNSDGEQRKFIKAIKLRLGLRVGERGKRQEKSE